MVWTQPGVGELGGEQDWPLGVLIAELPTDTAVNVIGWGGRTTPGGGDWLPLVKEAFGPSSTPETVAPFWSMIGPFEGDDRLDRGVLEVRDRLLPHRVGAVHAVADHERPGLGLRLADRFRLTT